MSPTDTYPIERWEQTIAEGFAGTRGLDDASLRGAVEGAVAALDSGDVRVASPPAKAGGEWVTHAWLKQAILLYFRMHVSAPLRAGDIEYFDKVPPKRNLEAFGVRVVPPGVARYGSFLERNVILMPGFVNIGARVGEGAVLGAGVVLTASTAIVDVTGEKPVESKGFVPPHCVVIPGYRPKAFPAGKYGVPCALVIGRRKASTDTKTSLNDALREFGVAV